MRQSWWLLGDFLSLNVDLGSEVDSPALAAPRLRRLTSTGISIWKTSGKWLCPGFASVYGRCLEEFLLLST